MPEPKSYNYAVIRIVPRVEKEEFINAGVIVYSPEQKFLDAKVNFSEERLRSLWPSVEVENIRKHLESIRMICAGEVEGGPIAKLSLSERFHWLTSPRSTMIQISPVRTGISGEPADVLDRLTGELVA